MIRCELEVIRPDDMMICIVAGWMVQAAGCQCECVCIIFIKVKLSWPMAGPMARSVPEVRRQTEHLPLLWPNTLLLVSLTVAGAHCTPHGRPTSCSTRLTILQADMSIMPSSTGGCWGRGRRGRSRAWSLLWTAGSWTISTISWSSSRPTWERNRAL